MATIDNSKIFLDGIYTDTEIKIPANTTYAAGTVLGRNSDGDMVAFSTDNNVAADGNNPAFETQAIYVLAQTVKNASNSAATVELARVYECGTVNKSKLVFIKAADASNDTVLDTLKQSGFNLVNVHELTE